MPNLPSPYRVVQALFLMCLGAILYEGGKRLAEMPPSRPSHVPSAATWAGGRDGGPWINCMPTGRQNVLRCDVYGHLSGTVLESGDYRIDLPYNGKVIPISHTAGRIQVREATLTRIDF